MKLYAEIESFLSSYFESLYTQDLELLDSVFLSDSILFSQLDDETIIRPFDQYREIVENRESPESMDDPREEKITMIDILSERMAVARVELRLFDNIMVDHLSLLKTDKGWKIAAKTFTKLRSADTI